MFCFFLVLTVLYDHVTNDGNKKTYNLGNATVEFESTELNHDDESAESSVPFEVIIVKEQLGKELIFECHAKKEENDEHELLIERVLVRKMDDDGDEEGEFFF